MDPRIFFQDLAPTWSTLVLTSLQLISITILLQYFEIEKFVPIVSFYQRYISSTFAADSVPSLITKNDNLHDCYDENE